MVGPEPVNVMNRRLRAPTVRQRLIYSALAASLVLNAAFLINGAMGALGSDRKVNSKPPVETFVRFVPKCFANKWDGMVPMTGKLSDAFVKEIVNRLGNGRVALGKNTNGLTTIYIPQRLIRQEKSTERLRMLTQSVAETIYERTELGGRRMTADEVFKLRTTDCKFQRKYALTPNNVR